MRVIPTPHFGLCQLLRLGLLLLSASVRSSGAETQQIDLGGGVSIELVRVEPGSFQQGSPATEPKRGSDETPRTVALTRPFLLGKYPVTRGAFARFVEETRYRTEAETGTSGGFGWDGAKLVQRRDFTWKNPGFPQTDDHPVTLVTYADARAFLTWLSRKSGRTFSLPSEAQWEYACRAGSTTAFPKGDAPERIGDLAWLRTNSPGGTQPVGKKPLNAWGLGELPGHVWQWCEDWFAPYPAGPATDPLQKQSNLSDKPRRVLRGGSWTRDATALRSAARYRNDPASRNADNGFRVMTLDLAPAAALAASPTPKPAPDRSPVLERTEPLERDGVAPADASTVDRLNQHGDARPHTPRGGGFVGILFAGGILAGIIVLIRAIARRGGTGVTPGNMASTRTGPVRTRVVDDGFWIESNALPAGSVVECRYVVNGQQATSNVAFQGGGAGQFVFTGGRPSSVSIAVLPGGGPTRGIGESPLGRAAGMFGETLGDVHVRSGSDDDRPREHGHPPAY
ncbi:MAG: formylglycine-generating enzyme family protein [Chthoniobacteraceae bacterium]